MESDTWGSVADFLRFFFTDTDNIFDMKKGFTYLDKEMAQIAVDGEPESHKYVDKLVKVYTRGGSEQWVLVHVEVQQSFCICSAYGIAGAAAWQTNRQSIVWS